MIRDMLRVQQRPSPLEGEVDNAERCWEGGDVEAVRGDESDREGRDPPP